MRKFVQITGVVTQCVTAVSMIACSSSDTPIPTAVPVTTIIDPNFAAMRGIAIGLRVDTDARSARTTVISTTASRAADSSVASFGAALSLVGNDAIEVYAGDIERASTPSRETGLVRVTMSIRFVNKLPSVRLVRPTWPTNPSEGVLLIPFEMYAIASGTSVGAAGARLTDLPLPGLIRPAKDWIGGPYNFFAPGSPCVEGQTLCVRFAPFSEPLRPGATSQTRRLSFDVAPEVRAFRANLLLVADLANDR